MQKATSNCPVDKLYSLKDLFESDPKEIENNVYEMVEPIVYKDQQQLKYVQIRREEIKT